MNQEEYDKLSQVVRESELRSTEERTKGIQQEVMMGQNERGMIAEQLDLGEELDRIDYLLRGYVIDRDDKGNTQWVAPDNNDMVILSDFGVHLIRNTIAWYLNKNTLLSNYDEDTINHKMEDFASDLNDTIFMEYEKVFKYPTFDDCKKSLIDRIQKKKDLRIFALELLGRKVSDIEKKEIEDKLLKEIEPMIEKELQKIKEQIIKNKLKRFLITIREIQDAVHSTYLRAWKGQERLTLRQHIHISETKGGYNLPTSSTSLNPLDWFKKR